MKHFAIYKNKNSYSAFPGDIKRLQNGDLLVGFREAPAKGVFSAHCHPESCGVFIRSRDNGKTWENKTVVFKDKNPGRCFQAASATQLKNGVILAISFHIQLGGRYTCESRADGVFIAESDDNGCHWSKPARMEIPGFYSAATYAPILELPDGELLIPLYGGKQPGEKSRAFVMKSCNGGKTWKDIATIAFDPLGSIDFYEPTLCCLRSGKIICMIRESVKGYLYYSESADKGKTWSFPRKTDVWGFPAHLLQLEDGRVLCVYGYRRPPYGIRACLSRDEGKTWDLQNEIIIRSDGFHGDLGYPGSLELEPGRILSVYYFHTGKPVANTSYGHYSEPDGIRYIAGTLYDV